MGRTVLAVTALSALLACGGSKPAATTPDNTGGGSAAAAGSGAASGSAAAGPNVTVGAALVVTPQDATVTIDDIVMGKAHELDPVLALAPGLHTLVVSQPGFKPYRMEFAVTDKVESFTIKLDPAK